MLQLFAGAALFGVAMYIYDSLQQRSSSERNRWYAKREEVQRSIEWHREQITQHLEQAKQSYDFHVLVNMHFSGVKVADEAYKLLKDARVSLDAIGTALVETKTQRDLLFAKRKDTKSKEDRDEISKEIDSLQQLRKSLFENKDEIKRERDELSEKVKKLNSEVHDLKNAINERTGSKGREWYQRLEARKAQKRHSSNNSGLNDWYF
jgi:uncharacterized coiled-coil DUF342 family protein